MPPSHFSKVSVTHNPHPYHCQPLQHPLLQWLSKQSVYLVLISANMSFTVEHTFNLFT